MEPLSAPLKVSIDLTQECNLACAHCRCHAPNPGRLATTHSILDLVDELAALKVFRIAFSGGEPLLRPDAPDILEHALRVAPGRVSLSTNATLLDQDLLDRLQPWSNRLTINVSVDGSAETHDSFRGKPGALGLTMAAVDAAAAGGFRVGVTTTLTTVNHPVLGDIAELVRRSGAFSWTVVEVLPVGAAGNDLLLDDAARTAALSELERLRIDLATSGVDVRVRLPFADGRRVRCRGGLTECGVTASGDVVGCRLLPEHTEWHISERSFADGWADASSFAWFRHSSVPDACAACADGESCRGGCKVYSSAADSARRDPRCTALG